MDKFKEKYRIASSRLPHWDYGSNGLYFITICTQNRHPYFGNILPTGMETQNMASTGMETQNRASTGMETQNIAPTGMETQNIAPTGMETQNIAPTGMETQNIAPTGMETQNIASLRGLTEIGRVAFKYWSEIPDHYPFIELDEFVVMPNHVHGILFINKPAYHNWQQNAFGPQSGNLAAIIRGYKAAVKTYATTHQIPFTWQSRYHDHNPKHSLNLLMFSV